MNNTYKLFFALVLLLSNVTIIAQVSIEKSDKQIFVLGKKYYLHEVKRGQTLYSISKAYDVSEDDIRRENPELQHAELKSGSEIRIPVYGQSNQTVNNSTQEEYITHTVERKQTMYFLTRKYNVSEQELVRLNPEIKDGLKPGQVLKIPKPGSSTISGDGNYQLHTIQPGETLFSLAQRYGVEIATLKMENPELYENGPKIGQVLRIPSVNKSFEQLLTVTHENITDQINYDYDPLYFEEPGVTPCNSFNYNSGMKFKVAVLLPLNTLENYSLRTSGRYYKNTARFYEFYQGLLLAAKKMKELSNVSVEFYVKDTKASVQRTREILSLTDMQQMDLIIGPVYSENFKLASAFAKEYKINIIAPFKLKHEDLVVTNPFVFLTNPSDETEIANICSFLTNSYDRSIIMIHNGTPEEEEMVQMFKNKLVKSFASYNNINEIVFKEVNFKMSGASAIEDALSVGLQNIVIVPSNDMVFITNVVTKLNYLTNKYKITVYGMTPWEQSRNIDVEYLKNLQFHYGTTSYIDEERKQVKDFDYQYKAYFKTDPTSYSYMGYDITYFFLNTLKDYGKHFQFCLPQAGTKSYNEGLRFDFNFERVSPFSGFENNWLSIVKIDNDLKLQKVK